MELLWVIARCAAGRSRGVMGPSTGCCGLQRVLLSRGNMRHYYGPQHSVADRDNSCYGSQDIGYLGDS